MGFAHMILNRMLPMLPNLVILFFCAFLLPSVLLGQYFYESEDSSSFASEKPVVDYYEKVDDKSFYQQKRIHRMKGDINSYSARLHDLQDRFDKIFYGMSSSKDFRKPFDMNTQPQRPKVKRWFDQDDANETLFARNEPEPVVSQPRSPSTNQLAFRVESPGEFKGTEGETISLFEQENVRRKKSLRYFIISPSVVIPHKIHRANNALPKPKYKKYEMGFGLNVAGGITHERWRFGLGGIYKKNKHHSSSYYVERGRHSLSSDSQTVGGYLDMGYQLPLGQNFDGYFGFGLGYYLSMIGDPRDRKQHDILLIGSLGLAWYFSDNLALRLGYRYQHEEEVHAHLIVLGLGFDF